MAKITNDFTISKPSDAGPSDRFNKDDNEGNLILFIAPELLEGVETAHGVSNCAEMAYMIVLDGDDPGAVWTKTRLWGAALVPALTEDEAELVLGRLVKGTAQRGKNAPWLLEQPTADDEKAAEVWIAEAVDAGVLSRKRNGRIVIDPEAAPF